MEHQLEQCRDAGVTKVSILANHLNEKISEFIENLNIENLSIEVILDGENEGTGSALLNAIDYLPDQFYILYGDIYFDINLTKFAECHQERKSDITVFSHPNNHPYDSDLIEVDDKGFINKFFRPKNEYYFNRVNAAIYILKKAVLIEHSKEKNGLDIVKDIFDGVLKSGGKIYAYDSIEYAKDIGTPDRMNAALDDIKSGIPQKRSNQFRKPCVFLDRDGVINKEAGYIRSPGEFKLNEGITDIIRLCNRLGLLCIVITNQPVIARGEVTNSQLELIHRKMHTLLGEEHCYVDDIYVCPHHPDIGYKGEVEKLKISCDCRKPKPGMINDAINKYNIDVKKSIFIGDHLRDMEAAKASGVIPIFLNSQKHHEKYKIDGLVEITTLENAYSIVEEIS